MKRTFNPTHFTTLPRLDANGAAVLAQSLETAATRDENGAPLVLPEPVAAALADMHTARLSLQEVLTSAPDPEPELRSRALQEGAAIGAFYDMCTGWRRLAGRVSQGDVAAMLIARLFSDGLSFVNSSPKNVWGVVETKLKIIERENLEPQIAQLGATPVLAHLREVHARFGQVTGATGLLRADEPAQVRTVRQDLEGSMRLYVVAVAGSIQRRRPETQALAEMLLRPLLEWREPRPRRDEDDDKESPGAPTGGKPTPPQKSVGRRRATAQGAAEAKAPPAAASTVAQAAPAQQPAQEPAQQPAQEPAAPAVALATSTPGSTDAPTPPAAA